VYTLRLHFVGLVARHRHGLHMHARTHARSHTLSFLGISFLSDNQALTSAFLEPYTGELASLEVRALQLLGIFASQLEAPEAPKAAQGAGEEGGGAQGRTTADQKCTEVDPAGCGVAVYQAKQESMIATRFREQRRQAVEDIQSECRRRLAVLGSSA
jgi:hypothetical protein